jgi:hypothetical protein
VPHGNAEVERIFLLLADMKTKKRNKLKPDTITALMRIRLDLIYKNYSCFNYPLNQHHFAKLNTNMYQNNNNAVLVNQLDLDKDEDDVLFNV